MKASLVMVLNDGETYTGLGNCKIIAVNEELYNEHDVDDDMDSIVADIYNKGETEHGRLVAEFTHNMIVVGEPTGATISLDLSHRH